MTMSCSQTVRHMRNQCSHINDEGVGVNEIRYADDRAQACVTAFHAADAAGSGRVACVLHHPVLIVCSVNGEDETQLTARFALQLAVWAGWLPYTQIATS